MTIDKLTIEVLVRAFFHSYFSKAAGALTKDITKAQPITIKQIMVKHIDNISTDFNARIARAFAVGNGVDIPVKLSTPKTFEGATALIKYTLKGNKEMYDFMVERYKYHFMLAMSGTIERTDNLCDTELLRLIEIMK